MTHNNCGRDWLWNPVDATNQKVGLLGGTFDPVHLGHLIMGEWAREFFDLNHLILMPNPTPPHKRGEFAPKAESTHRLNMLKLAVKSNPLFKIWDYEIKKQGYNYTVETLNYLSNLIPRSQFYFIIGADSLEDIVTWKNYHLLLKKYNIIVCNRSQKNAENVLNFIKTKPEYRLFPLEIPDIAISSSLIRQRCLRKKTIKYLTIDEIADYIEANNLYSTKE